MRTLSAGGAGQPYEPQLRTCVECGNDDASEGYAYCLDCLEAYHSHDDSS